MAIELVPGRGFVEGGTESGAIQIPLRGFLDSGPSGPPDTTPPTLTGSITVGTVTSTSIAISWPAGADDVAVTSYEVSSNGGSSWFNTGVTTLNYTFLGLSPSTSYTLQVRARDAAANVSTPALSVNQSTNAAGPVVGSIAGSESGADVASIAGSALPQVLGEPVCTPTGTVLGSTTIRWVQFIRVSDMTAVLTLSNVTTAANGMLPVSSALFTSGVTYIRVLSSATGADCGAKAFVAS